MDVEPYWLFLWRSERGGWEVGVSETVCYGDGSAGHSGMEFVARKECKSEGKDGGRNRKEGVGFGGAGRIGGQDDEQNHV